MVKPKRQSVAKSWAGGREKWGSEGAGKMQRRKNGNSPQGNSELPQGDTWAAIGICYRQDFVLCFFFPSYIQYSNCSVFPSLLLRQLAWKQDLCSIGIHQMQVLIPRTRHNPLFVIIIIFTATNCNVTDRRLWLHIAKKHLEPMNP